jgi:hypothetical protein
MFLCFPGAGSDSVEIRAEAYLLALSDLTPDEICTVCAKAARGEIGNPRFLPSAAELHAAVRPMAVTKPKPLPFWRPHQDRFLTSSGTLFVTEGGKTEVYTSDELKDAGYALPDLPPLLNRKELEERGVTVLRPLSRSEPDPNSNELTRKIAALVKPIP